MRITRDNGGYRRTPRNEVAFGDVFSLVTADGLSRAQYLSLGTLEGDEHNLYSLRLSDRVIAYSSYEATGQVGIIGQLTGVKVDTDEGGTTTTVGNLRGGQVFYTDGVLYEGKPEALVALNSRALDGSIRLMALSLAKSGRIVALQHTRPAYVVGNANLEIVAV